MAAQHTDADASVSTRNDVMATVGENGGLSFQTQSFYRFLHIPCAQVFEIVKRAMVAVFYRGTINFAHYTTGQMFLGTAVD